MATISRNIGGDHRAATSDWQDATADLAANSEADIKDLVNRQELAIGDTWAQRWMLTHMAKHLFQELERQCLDSPAATAIANVTYSDDGTVESWAQRDA